MQIAARTGAWEKSGGEATPMTWADGYKYFGSITLYADPLTSASTTSIPIVPGHSITWSNCGNVSNATMMIVDENDNYLDYWGMNGGNRTITPTQSNAYGLLLSVLTENKYIAKVVDNTDGITLFENGMILVPV